VKQKTDDNLGLLLAR